MKVLERVRFALRRALTLLPLITRWISQIYNQL